MILTSPVHEGGVGITPKIGEWHQVESIFPLHNSEFDQAWLKRWATKWTIDDNELDHLCEHFGTRVALYFAFLQFYLISLAIPATMGLLAFFFLPEYSLLYSLGISIWATRRAAFVGSKTSKDPVTGQAVPVFNPMSRLSREVLTIPFGILAGAILAVVLTAIFSVEVFIGEVYDGPLKSILTFTPTILFSVLVGPFSNLYMKAAHKLTIYENHETDAKFNAAITRKSFLLNFMTSYTALFLTLYVYLPFGHAVVPKLDVFGLTSSYAAYGVKAKPFVLDSSRIRNQLFYFAVTAQVVNLQTRDKSLRPNSYCTIDTKN
ncbi:Putative uncharacterized protein [Taphrina deformans PYCC 5710]|uniref:Anoctamin transmembrane domain-containing protein n=1 Tax=Taphrina deformans (strain PYCC 5710 / ATCC 11124 / CBS 356.35 / IMI 108563 / JCM 9778 / NBRC 8474) TaxID=1097556 RepID=R4XEU6_TAPDE|nr:Putative uncharacterized protein [Taphrina deformans PYCC 5710]|eukprot:CCG83001.1 Putative uncharacterized protein [Taphrina deformans PYCC 5710]